MLLRTWRHRNSRSLLLGLQSGKDTLEESLVAAFKAKHTLAFSSVQFSHSVVSDSLWPHGLLHARLLCTSPTPGVYSSIALVMPSNHLILCRSLLLLPSIFPIIRVFFEELVLHIRWPNYWSFSFSIGPSNPLEKEMATHSSILAWRILWTEPGVLLSIGSHRVGHDWSD